MSQKSTKLHASSALLTIIKYGLFACLFMPLIMDSRFIFPYIFPKQAFFQIVVEAVFALYLFLAFKRPEFRPRSSWLFKALGAYFAIMVLSAVFGVNTYHSFWSNYERMAGVISLFHYLGFLFVAANVFKTQENWHSFFDASVIAGVLQSLYGLGQLAGIFTSSGGARIDGTIGNASFLAGYMLLNALFALWLALEKDSLRWRLFYGAALILNLVILYQTETRGAVLGLLAAGLALALFFIFARQKDLAQLPLRRAENLKKYIAGALVAGLLAAGAIWLARDSNFVAKQPTLQRITHISLSEGTSMTRLLAWRMSLKGFLERPLFGWGPENYYVVFNKYYDPNLYPVESWFDRAHNAFLDVLVNTGLTGFLAYLAAAALAFWSLWSAWRREKIKYHTAVIFSVILIAYAIQNFFVFDTQVTLLMISSIMGFLVWLSFRPAPVAVGAPARPNAFFTALVVLGFVLAAYFINIKPGLASTTGIGALGSLQQGQVAESLTQFKSALDIGTFGLPEVAMRVQDVATSLSRNSSASAAVKKEFVELAVDAMDRSLRLEPLNARFMMMLASIYLISADGSNSYLADADALLQKAMELSPTRQELYFYVGQVRMFQNRQAEALALFKRAVELNDKVALSRWNYGIVAIGVGQKELGEKEIKIARELDHEYKPADIRQVINSYTRTDDRARIIALHQEWMTLFPADAGAYASLAAFYQQWGDKIKAKELALQAAVVDSNYQSQVDEFIKSLGI